MAYSRWLVALLVVGCARMEPPPGGPPDSKPPQLIATSPDSMGIMRGFDEPAEFIFDEVISEGGGAGAGGKSGLAQLVILSPTTEDPEVDWKRSRIAVEPREGWQPDRVYRVELLPGVMDLRNNRSNERRVITFTTGAPDPHDDTHGTGRGLVHRSPRSECAGRGAPAAGQPALSGACGLHRQFQSRAHPAGGLSGFGSGRPESEPARRRPGGLRQRSNRPRQDQGRGPLGVRARYHPTAGHDGDRERQRLGQHRAGAGARSSSQAPASQRDRLGAAGLEPGESDLRTAQDRWTTVCTRVSPPNPTL